MNTLDKWFDENTKASDPQYKVFQSGVTVSAVSMRTRAMTIISGYSSRDKATQDLINMISNAIGQLPDIP